MLEELKEGDEPEWDLLGDWGNVFAYADEFTRDDVVKIIAMEEGTNDEEDWLGLFELKDGSYASVAAGCDYTGWG